MNITIKRAVTLAFLFAITSTTVAGESREVDKSLPAVEGGKVRFKTVDGDVSFVGWDKAQVKIIGQLGENIKDLIFENDGAETIIKLKNDKNYYKKGGFWHNNNHTDLEVFMPQTSKLYALNTSGDINIDGLKAGLKTKNVSGDITISNSKKYIYAYTSSGDVVMRDCHGDVHVETVSGDIDFNGEARRFEAASISGSIDGSVGETELLKASAISGNIDLYAALDDSGAVEASTVSGNIELVFDQELVNARIQMTTGPGGNIDNSISDATATESFVGSEYLEFKLGSGQSTVELETMSGKIQIAQR